MLLTQSTMPIIRYVAFLLGYVMRWIFDALSYIGIQNIGLCIIIFTVIVRLCMMPMSISQQRMTKINQYMQPEITKIQNKYKGRRDPDSMQKQNKEMQEVYDKYGSSPSGGCLQMVIQIPIFLALFGVIRKIPGYVPQIKALYTPVVNAIQSVDGHIDIINKIGDSLNTSYVSTLAANASSNEIIDVLNFFPKDAWRQLAEAMPSVSGTIDYISSKITQINSFIGGIDVAHTPGFHISIYLIIPFIAAGLQLLTTMSMQSMTSGGENQPGSGMTRGMMFLTPLMSLYFCIVTPAGLGIYWATSAAVQWIQQVIINARLSKQDINDIIAKNQEKVAKKKARNQKSMMERLSESSGRAEKRRQEYEERQKTLNDLSNMNLRSMNTTGTATNYGSGERSQSTSGNKKKRNRNNSNSNSGNNRNNNRNSNNNRNPNDNRNTNDDKNSNNDVIYLGQNSNSGGGNYSQPSVKYDNLGEIGRNAFLLSQLDLKDLDAKSQSFKDTKKKNLNDYDMGSKDSKDKKKKNKNSKDANNKNSKNRNANNKNNKYQSTKGGKK